MEGRTEGRKEGWKDRRTDRPYFIGPFWLLPGVQKLTFNITYSPAFQNVRGIMEELHTLLTPNKDHRKVFPDVPVVGFRNG